MSSSGHMLEGGHHHAGEGHPAGAPRDWLWLVGLLVFVGTLVTNALIFTRTAAHYAHWVEENQVSVTTEEHPPEYGVVISLYRALQLFHLHDTHWPGHWHHDYPYQAEDEKLINLARALGALVELGLPILALAFFFQGGLRQLSHRFWKRKGFLLVAGDSADAETLAAELRARKRRYVRVASRPATGHARAETRFLLPDEADEHASAPFWRNEVRAGAAAAVILLGEDDSENIRRSIDLERALPQGGPPVRALIHLRDLHLQKGLAGLRPPAGEHGPLTRLYFNRYELMARLLMRQLPLPPALVEDCAQPEHYVIIGFGQVGQNVALKLVKMGQQVVQQTNATGQIEYACCPPRITVIDRRGDEAVAAFRHSNPGVEKACTWQVKAIDCTSSEFLGLHFLEPSPGRPRCSLIFCLETEPLVVTTILMLLETLAHAPAALAGIYFRRARPGGVGDLLLRRSQAHSSGVRVVAFAPDEELLSEDLILNLSLDCMAEYLHEEWRRLERASAPGGVARSSAARPWAELSEEDREGNREAADHLWDKVRTLGFELAPAKAPRQPGEGAAVTEAELESAIEAQVEALSGAEHYRWMAWKMVLGWTYHAKRSPEEKHHDCLVPYAQLTPEQQGKDRLVIRAIPEIIKRGGLRVFRRLPGRV